MSNIILNIRSKNGGITIECRIFPHAKRTEIKGVLDGVLLVSIAAPPVEGKANEALIKLFSKILGVPKSHILILSGRSSRNKVVFVQRMSIERARTALKL